MGKVWDAVKHESTANHTQDDEREGYVLKFASASRSLDTLLNVSVDLVVRGIASVIAAFIHSLLVAT